jgi:hypothetical protein
MESASESVSLMIEYETTTVESPLQSAGIEIKLERAAGIAAGICTDQNYNEQQYVG